MMNQNGGGNGSLPITIGKIIHVEETEHELVNLKIQIDDLVIDKKNFYISDYLIKEYKREIRTDAIDDKASKQHLSGSTSIENDGGQGASSHSHTITDLTVHHTNIYTRDTLEVGDLVSILSFQEEQMYVILNRVVRL